jgi:hypothetical protein
VASARPDGHTLLLMSNGNAVSVGLFRKLPCDTLKDFVPVSTLGFFDIGIIVGANSRFATLRDAVAHAKANPGKLNVGTLAPARSAHGAAGGRGRLQRGLVERDRGTGRHPHRGGRQAQPRRVRGGGLAGRDRQDGQARTKIEPE